MKQNVRGVIDCINKLKGLDDKLQYEDNVKKIKRELKILSAKFEFNNEFEKERLATQICDFIDYSLKRKLSDIQLELLVKKSEILEHTSLSISELFFIENDFEKHNLIWLDTLMIS